MDKDQIYLLIAITVSIGYGVYFGSASHLLLAAIALAAVIGFTALDKLEERSANESRYCKGKAGKGRKGSNRIQ
jgi:hypothetical protein